jgi:hypothetical protein
MPIAKQGERVLPAPSDFTYMTLINFSGGMGTWGRNRSPEKSVRSAALAAREDFKRKKKHFPLVAIMWLVPGVDIYWEADNLPRWEGQDDGEEVEYWKLDVMFPGTYTVQ